MARFYIIVGPQNTDEHPGAPAPILVVEASDEAAARDRAEVFYRRSHPEIAELRLRITHERAASEPPG